MPRIAHKYTQSNAFATLGRKENTLISVTKSCQRKGVK